MVTCPSGGIIGTGNKDTLRGDGGNNFICAKGGNDTVNGKGGDDTLFGENGDDTLRGKNGDDVLVDGRGNDTLRGGNGKDTFYLLQGGSCTQVGDQQTFGSNYERIISYEPDEPISYFTSKDPAPIGGADHCSRADRSFISTPIWEGEEYEESNRTLLSFQDILKEYFLSNYDGGDPYFLYIYNADVGFLYFVPQQSVDDQGIVALPSLAIQFSNPAPRPEELNISLVELESQEFERLPELDAMQLRNLSSSGKKIPVVNLPINGIASDGRLLESTVSEVDVNRVVIEQVNFSVPSFNAASVNTGLVFIVFTLTLVLTLIAIKLWNTIRNR